MNDKEADFSIELTSEELSDLIRLLEAGRDLAATDGHDRHHEDFNHWIEQFKALSE